MSPEPAPRAARAAAQFGLVLAVLLLSVPGTSGSPGIFWLSPAALTATITTSAAHLAPAARLVSYHRLVALVDRPAQPPLQATPDPPGDRSRTERGDSNLVFQWDRLMDALALLVARFWLGCGALAVLGISVFFVVLWVKTRNRPRS